MLHLEMNVFTRRKKLEGISVCWVFTWKEKSQSISVYSTKTENNCTTKKVHWNHTDPDFKTNWFAIWIFDTTDGFKLPSIRYLYYSYITTEFFVFPSLIMVWWYHYSLKTISPVNHGRYRFLPVVISPVIVAHYIR